MTIDIIKLWNSLEGYKTYIVAILAGIVITAQLLNYITADTANDLLKYLGLAGTMTVASKVNRLINNE